MTFDTNYINKNQYCMSNMYFSSFGNHNPFYVDLPDNSVETGFLSFPGPPSKGSMPSQLYKSEWLHIMVPKTASLEGWI